MARFSDLSGKAVLITAAPAASAKRWCAPSIARAPQSVSSTSTARGASGFRPSSAIAPISAWRTCAISRRCRWLSPPCGSERVRFSVLVNNAARDDRHRIDEVTPAYWRERFATNIDHQFFAAQAVYREMIELGGGAIICMGSTSYMQSKDSFAAYKTAKSAVVGLTRALSANSASTTSA